MPAGFTVIDQRLLVFGLVVPVVVHFVENAVIFGFAVFVLRGPLAESLLLLQTFLIHFVALQLFHLTDVIFPIVADAGLFGGVLYEDGRVGIHVLAVLL